MFPLLAGIKNKRLQLGLTQKELAVNLGLSQSLIAKLEAGKLVPNYYIAVKIFSYLESMHSKNEKTCAEIMRKNVVLIKSHEKLERVIKVMKEKGISQAPVIENSKIIGSISEKKIYDELIRVKDKTELLKEEVSSIIEPEFPSINPKTPVNAILPLLKTSEAIVIKEKNKILGIITKSDLI